jgi:hypothetical protein
MFFDKKFKSLDIARQIIKNTGLDENLGILKQKRHAVPVPPKEILKMVMALSACNLVQTMKAEFITNKLSQETRDDITKDYIMESFRNQDLFRLEKGEMEGLRLGVMEVVEKLQGFWGEAEDLSGPGPRYYCVKEVLSGLGGGQNYELHDALFELMYLQYRHYLKYFKGFLGELDQEV